MAGGNPSQTGWDGVRGIASDSRRWETHYLIPTSTIVEEFVNPIRSSAGRRTGGMRVTTHGPNRRTVCQPCHGLSPSVAGGPRQAVQGSYADYSGRDAADFRRKTSYPAGPARRAAPSAGHPTSRPIHVRTHAGGGLGFGYSTGSTRMPIPVPCRPRKRTGASDRTRRRSAYVRS